MGVCDCLVGNTVMSFISFLLYYYSSHSMQANVPLMLSIYPNNKQKKIVLELKVASFHSVRNNYSVMNIQAYHVQTNRHSSPSRGHAS